MIMAKIYLFSQLPFLRGRGFFFKTFYARVSTGVKNIFQGQRQKLLGKKNLGFQSGHFDLLIK
jgi:hypothetical protein